jgi:hypothetical protein
MECNCVSFDLVFEVAQLTHSIQNKHCFSLTLSTRKDTPYLNHVKALSIAWPPLRYLADFMEVGTTPLRWKSLRTNPREREDRLTRTNVAILDISKSGERINGPTKCRSTKELEDSLAQVPSEKSSTRIIIVEDLSRSVVELLGAKFDIDPHFFREHIDDYTWYNIRDRWMVPRSLNSTQRYRDWFQIQHVRPRIYQTSDLYETALRTSNTFNVYRRPDSDENQFKSLDEDSLVALSRTKTSIWIRRNKLDDDMNIGETNLKSAF